MRASASATRQPTLPSPTTPTRRRARIGLADGAPGVDGPSQHPAALWRGRQFVVVGEPQAASDNAHRPAPRSLESAGGPIPEAGAPGLVRAEGEPNERQAGGLRGRRDAVALRLHVLSTHPLPAGAGVTVEKGQPGALLAREARGSRQVVRLEAGAAMERALRLPREDQFRDQRRRPACALARTPQREAEVLLSPAGTKVGQKVIAGGLVNRLEKGRFKAHSSSSTRSRWRLT